MQSLEEMYIKEKEEQLLAIKKSKIPIHILIQSIIYFTFGFSIKTYNILNWKYEIQSLYVVVAFLLVYILHKEFSNLTQQCIEDFEQKIKGLEK